MTKPGWSIARRLIGDERGLALPLVAVAIPVIFGSTALAVDYGYVLQVQNTLQYKTDAAALAGAQGLIDGTYSSKAKLYSASAAVGGVNTISGITVPAPTITTKCSTTLTNAGVRVLRLEQQQHHRRDSRRRRCRFSSDRRSSSRR